MVYFAQVLKVFFVAPMSGEVGKGMPCLSTDRRCVADVLYFEDEICGTVHAELFGSVREDGVNISKLLNGLVKGG